MFRAKAKAAKTAGSSGPDKVKKEMSDTGDDTKPSSGEKGKEGTASLVPQKEEAAKSVPDGSETEEEEEPQPAAKRQKTGTPEKKKTNKKTTRSTSKRIISTGPPPPSEPEAKASSTGSETAAAATTPEGNYVQQELRLYDAAFLWQFKNCHVGGEDTAPTDDDESINRMCLFEGVLLEYLKIVNSDAHRKVFRVLLTQDPTDRQEALKSIVTVEVWERVDSYVNSFLLGTKMKKKDENPDAATSAASATPTLFTATDLPQLRIWRTGTLSMLGARDYSTSVNNDGTYAVVHLGADNPTLDRVSLRDLSIQSSGVPRALSLAVDKYTKEVSAKGSDEDKDKPIFQPPSSLKFENGVLDDLRWHAFYVAELERNAPGTAAAAASVHGISTQQAQQGFAGHSVFVTNDMVPRTAFDNVPHGFSVPVDATTPSINALIDAAITQGNSNGGDSKEKAKPIKRRSLKTVGNRSYLDGEPSELDVKYGRGGGTNNHKGNVIYLLEKLKLQPGYILLATQKGKKVISQSLVERTHDRGGRFVAKDEDNGKWYIVDDATARRKASQTLREDKTPEEQDAKRSFLSRKLMDMDASAARKRKRAAKALVSLQEAGQSLLELNSTKSDSSQKSKEDSKNQADEEVDDIAQV